MQFSHSRVEMYNQCAFRFMLSYIRELDTLSDYEAGNHLNIGHLVHDALEQNLSKAIDNYCMSYPIINDAHINEIIKIECLYNKMKAVMTEIDGTKEFEVEISTDEFHGFIDMLVHNRDGTIDLYDFKYSNNIEKYLESGQLDKYKYFYEKQTGKIISNLYYMFIPKTQIRQKKTEDLYQFRKRIVETLKPLEIQIHKVDYDPNKVIDFMIAIKNIYETKEWNRNENRLCEWCNFKEFCLKGEDYMLLPKNERREKNARTKTKTWIYGMPTSGKTTMLDDAPNPLNLNTDGNIQDVTMPYISIKDIVTVEGRQTKRKLAWEVFKEVIDELEKKQNDFQTIIIDLVEDTREMCRIFKYEELGIQHESDAGFGKGWDIIKTEYLSTMRRFFNLDYDNLVIVSHEDVSKDITKKSGDKITRIMPNIQEAVANKLAGMVDVIARVVIEDDGSRTLNFKTNDIIFGGTRLKNVPKTKIPLSWESLMEVYNLNKNTEKKAEIKPDVIGEYEKPSQPDPNDYKTPEFVDDKEEPKTIDEVVAENLDAVPVKVEEAPVVEVKNDDAVPVRKVRRRSVK